MSDSAIHDAEREESRCASYGLSEMERAVTCRHYYNRRAVCIWCGDVGADWSEA